jgi:sortase A
MNRSVSRRTHGDVPTRRPRRTLAWIGAGLVAVGLALVAYLTWQLVGTNVVSERRQDALVDQLQDRWRTSGSDGAGDGRPPADATSVAAEASSGATALIRIPRFGDDYVMPVLAGVEDEALSSGYGHFDGSAGPGAVGNYALAAHRVTHGEPLRDMPELRAGDEVLIETRTTVYTYELDTDGDDLVVDLHETWVVAPRPVNPDPAGIQPSGEKRLLTLVTCAELFHTEDRLVAFGHLVDARPK